MFRFYAGLIILSFFLLIIPAPSTAESGPKRPEGPFNIDFSKRYDVTLSTRDDQTQVYRNCLILGFTGKGPKDQQEKLRPLNETFSGWVVIELPDKRLLYVHGFSIFSLEQSKE